LLLLNFAMQHFLAAPQQKVNPFLLSANFKSFLNRQAKKLY